MTETSTDRPENVVNSGNVAIWPAGRWQGYSDILGINLFAVIDCLVIEPRNRIEFATWTVISKNGYG